jgi:hypothetical protein
LSLQFVERITPEHNIEALRERDGVRTVIGRHCEGCGETHDPDVVFHGGRYRVGARWLCVTCMLAGK